MKLPFTHTSDYVTPLSIPELESLLVSLKEREVKCFFLSFKMYKVEIAPMHFTIQKAYKKNGPAYPLIKGEIIANSPTVLRITIRPNYFLLLVYLSFALTFIYGAFTAKYMTSGDVVTEITIGERFLCGGFSSLILSAIAYFNVIRPVETGKEWLMYKLALEPVTESECAVYPLGGHERR